MLATNTFSAFLYSYFYSEIVIYIDILNRLICGISLFWSILSFRFKKIATKKIKLFKKKCCFLLDAPLYFILRSASDTNVTKRRSPNASSKLQKSFKKVFDRNNTLC
jgi:hypothetical protein